MARQQRLRDVAVMPAQEFAAKALGRLDAPRGGPLDQALIRLRPMLEGAHVLECQYIPEDASTSYTLVRVFRYRAEPGGWAAIAAELPEEFPLRSTGAARTAAPRTLAEVDRAL